MFLLLILILSYRFSTFSTLILLLQKRNINCLDFYWSGLIYKPQQTKKDKRQLKIIDFLELRLPLFSLQELIHILC